MTSLSALLAVSSAAWPFMSVRQAGGPLSMPEKMREVIAVNARTPGSCDEYWFCLGAGGEISTCRGAFAKLAAFAPACKKAGIAVGFQQGVTLGHGDVGDPAGGILAGKLAEFPESIWQRDREGKVRRMFCPRAPELAAYEADFIAALVEELHPASLWLDDDLRLGTGVPGCFCDRCLAAFSAECGASVSRGELASRLSGGAERDPIRRAWRRFNSESLAAYARAVRAAVNRVDPGLRLGYQAVGACETGSGTDYHPLLIALSDGGRRPVGIRPGHGNYREDVRGMVRKLLWVSREAERCRRYGDVTVASIVYEQENYTREALHKSADAAMLESALALAAGCDALSEYWWDAARDEPIGLYGEFSSCAAKWRPHLERLGRLARGTRATGFARYVGSAADCLVRDSVEGPRDLELALMGVAVAPDSADPTVWYVDETTAEELGDADGAILAQRRVLVHAPVAAALRARYGKTADDAFASGAWKAFDMDVLAPSGWEGCRLPTTAERRSFLDALDALAPQLVRIDRPHPFRLWPRVRADGRLAAVTVFNASIGESPRTELALRGVADGVAELWRSDGSSAPIPVLEGRVALPPLPPCATATVLVR